MALWFMHLRSAAPLLRVAAILGLFLLAVLMGLSASDYATRRPAPAPWGEQPAPASPPQAADPEQRQRH